MDWLEDRLCAECGQYVSDDRECQSVVCVRSRCGERKGHYDFAEAERRSLGATEPCERCLKAQEVHTSWKPSGGATGPYSQEKDEDVAKKINMKVHCNFYGNRLSDRHSTGGVPRYVRS
jgi:hypothetical protein